ncbi:ABC transporter ATP-binding protein [Catenovulum maritimum]|uniref:ABC transporter domain-containing protein n=1 Tax=Catenovulum maritimum TaxID=1513271 RepID=A0A0J8GVK2_9ALTE|nr:ABC transporter ATP-binding protein [Catenovulum maritimum]KMT65339.1 hypothetical protein XM47_09930 [Catenovulum maritimum]
MLKVLNLGWKINQVDILKSINVEVTQNSVTSIVGPNGSGKTSLLRCIYRQIDDFSGDVLVNQQNQKQLGQLDFAKQVSVVTQQISHNFALKVIDIVRMGQYPYQSAFKASSESLKQDLNEILINLEIEPLKHKVFSSLSGGEQQRVLIARALAQKPKLLILDEPTNHLDIHFQHQILSFLQELEISVLMTIHDLNLAAQYSDQIIMLNKGQIESSGSPEEVLTENSIKKVFNLDNHVGVNPMTNKLHVFFRNEMCHV